jgi:hypothetical protein
MVPHLRIWLIAIWSTSIAGAAVILGLALGHYEVGTFLWALAAGVVVGIPAALLNWAYLRPNRAREVGVLGQAPAEVSVAPLAPKVKPS